MTTAERDLVRLRLRNQRLAGTGFRRALSAAADRYGRFVNKAVSLSLP